jgi:hypothetical protein
VNPRARVRDKRRMRTLLALLMMSLAGPALAEAVIKHDTELVKGRCRFIADDGEVGHYAEKRCPGLAGARVHTVAGVNRVSLRFGWGKARPKEAVESWSLGDKLEWRGRRKGAAFKPHATIVPVKVIDDPSQKIFTVLAVIRMEARNACLLAVIDEAGNTDALALARATADAEAPAFSCRRDAAKVRVVGEPSYWAQMVIGFPGDPPQ